MSNAFSLFNTYNNRQELIINPKENGSYQKLSSTLTIWKEMGYKTIFVTGVYDLMHPCHKWYLRNVKLMGVKAILGKKEITYEEFRDNYRSLKLCVVVDGNSINARKKSYNPENGGSVRPVLDWTQRAKDVAEIIWTPVIDSKPEFVVDLVTGHDDEEFVGTPFADYSKLILGLSPDYWAIHRSNIDSFEKITNKKVSDEFGATETIIMPEVDYEMNPVDSQVYSTTNLIKRIRE